MRNILHLLFIVKKSFLGHMFSTIITVVSIALATGLVMSVFSLKDQSYEAFTGGTFGYDAVAGAGGSELQIVLNSVYHLETSPGNVPWRIYEELKGQPGVVNAIPYALGDSYRGFRIVGTTTDIFRKIGVETEDGIRIRGRGELFDPSEKEAVIGSYVAQKSDLEIGSKFRPAHGLYHAEDSAHEDEFEVVGIVSPTNTPHDRVIWIPIDKFFRTEGHVLRGGGAQYRPAGEEKIPDSYKEISSVMLQLQDPAVGFNLKKRIEEDNTGIILAWPVDTVVAELFAKLGWFRDILGFVAYAVVLVSLGAVLGSVYNTIHDRRREFAVIRALGGGRGILFNSVIIESVLITAAGTCLGFIINLFIMAVASFIIKQEIGIVLDVFEIHAVHMITPLVMVVLGIVVGVIPAYKAYRTNVEENLSPK